MRLDYAPVESKSMEEGGKSFHQDEDANGQNGPEGEDDPKDEAANPAFELESLRKDHLPQYFGKF